MLTARKQNTQMQVWIKRHRDVLRQLLDSHSIDSRRKVNLRGCAELSGGGA